MANALFERRFERDLRKKNKRRSMWKDWFRTTSNQFKKQPFQPDALFDTEIGRRSNVHQKGFYNQITMGTSQVRSSTFIRKKPSFQSNRKSEIYTVWKVSKCRVISGPYFPVFRPVFGHFSRSARKQTHVCPLVKERFIKIPEDISPSGRIRHFFSNWKNMTSGKSILSMVKELELNFLSEPVQNRFPKSMNMSKKARMLVENEIQRLLRKEAITRTNYCKNKFVSNHFLREKKDGRYRPMYQLLPYYHFKMEGLKNRKK